MSAPVTAPTAGGVAWDRWLAGATGTHGLHPDGFPVYLTPAEIAADEYGSEDPYSVEANLEGPFQQARTRVTLALVARLLGELGRSEATLLDAGCGEGWLTREVLRAHPGLAATGLDYSVAALRRARTVVPEAALVAASAFAPPFPDHAFDAVLCNNLWEHVTDPVGLARAHGRVTRPGGWLIVSTPNRFRLGNLARRLRGQPVEFLSRLHVTEYTPGQLTEQLAFAGWDTVWLGAGAVTQQLGTWKQKLAFGLGEPLLKRFDPALTLEPTLFALARKR